MTTEERQEPVPLVVDEDMLEATWGPNGPPVTPWSTVLVHVTWGLMAAAFLAYFAIVCWSVR